MKRLVFTPEERDRVRDRVLELARSDPRITAAAMVGSLARGAGDRWSDLDLTFGLAGGTPAAEVLIDWTRTLGTEFDAVHLFDLPYLSSIYRVFLLPGCLQVDLSFTPESDFGALGPHFRMLFGRAVSREQPPPASARNLFGLAVHHAVRARFSLARGRLWQAEHWISGVREQVLALACLRLGLEPRQARGYDELPAAVTDPACESLVRSLEPGELLRALRCAIEVLLRESDLVPEIDSQVKTRLRELVAEGWPDPV